MTNYVPRVEYSLVKAFFLELLAEIEQFTKASVASMNSSSTITGDVKTKDSMI